MPFGRGRMPMPHRVVVQVVEVIAQVNFVANDVIEKAVLPEPATTSPAHDPEFQRLHEAAESVPAANQQVHVVGQDHVGIDPIP